VETGFRRINVGAILTNDGFVLIDTPPFPDDARAWRILLSEVSDKPILAVVSTDCHRDRLLGNSWFDSAVIIAHDETILQAKSFPTTFVDSAVDALVSSPSERYWFSGAQLRIPSVGFTYRMHLRYGGSTIPLLAMPGPTLGNVWVHLPEQRILFVGDSIVTSQHPYISSPCTKNWLDNLTVLRRSRFPADTIVPGRGPIVDKSATEPLSNYLRLVRRRVQSLYRAGRPRADTSALVPELLDLFPYHESELENIQRRIKVGLDRIYEEFKTNDKVIDSPDK
jgi:glyoxylase-like metal-dependent hydrolase (beta-lactamase superfamily II)